MSEQHPLLEQGNEHLLSAENSVEHKGSLKSHERELTDSEREHGTEKSVDSHRETVEQHAIAGVEHSATERETPQSSTGHPLIATLQLKTAAWSRSMTRTRKKLAIPDRVFSKVIHNEAIDRPSEFIGKTIARPSGMLWGSVFAFLGTSALLWVTRYYGYEFNYLLFILLFVGGAIVGTALEGAVYLVRKNR